MRARSCVGIAVLFTIAIASCITRGFDPSAMTERGLRLLASARALDLGNEAPLWVLAMKPLGTRAGVVCFVGAIALFFRSLRALRVSPLAATIALAPLVLDRALIASVNSGEPTSAALLGFAILAAVHVTRAGIFGRIGASPLATGAAAAVATLLSFDLAWVALLVTIARHPTRRIALVSFVASALVVRAALGDVLPPALLNEAALLDRLPAMWGFAPGGRWWASTREAFAASTSMAGALPAAVGLAFACMAVATHRRAFASFFRLFVLPVGALLSVAIFAPFGAPSATRTAPVVAGVLLVAALGLDRLRTKVAPVVASLIIAGGALVVHTPPKIAHRTIVERGPVLCSPCGIAWLTRTDLLTLPTLDGDGRDAIRDGRLLGYARARGALAVALDPNLFVDTLLGPKMREELVREGSVYRVRKTPDDAFAIRHDVTLGEGSPQLGDGFVGTFRGAESRASHAELVFTTAPGASKLQISMRSAFTTAQPVELSLDGAPPTLVSVGPSTQWFDVPLPSGKKGRRRLRLSFPEARNVVHEGLDAWRTPDGRARLAVVVDHMRLVDEGDRLPPDGPGLADKRFDRVLRSGFLPVERDVKPPGVWAIGPAELRFSTPSPAAACVLLLTAGPPPGGDQTVTLTLNGKRLGDLHYPPDGISSLSVDVPSGTLVDGENVLILSFARVGEGRTLYMRDLSLRPRAP